jgi:hypothetical protein
MPDFHQPDDADRAEADVSDAADVGEVPDERDDDVLREARPSSRHDPNAPRRPKT